MSKYLNFGIFLTIFGIVSVAHAMLNNSTSDQKTSNGKINDNTPQLLSISGKSMKSPLPILSIKSQFLYQRNFESLASREKNKKIILSQKQTNLVDEILSSNRSKNKPFNSIQYVVPKPSEISIIAHPYEEPVGLKQDEVINIRNQVLERSNFYRNRHGCNLFTLNENMNNHAQEWANTLVPLYELRHRSKTENDIYGENIYGSPQWENIGEAAVDEWYNELRFVHENDTEDDLNNNSKIGDMIQLLWMKSKYMGIGVAKSKKNNYYYIVANLNPRGYLYGCILENIPIFKREHFEAAKLAYVNTLKTTMKQLENGDPDLVSSSNNASGDNGSKQSTNDSSSRNSNISNKSPTWREFITHNGEKYRVRIPQEREPIPYKYSEPLNLTPDEVLQIRKDVFAKANNYRNTYGMPLLKLDEFMNNYAQDSANFLAKNNLFQQRNPFGAARDYGEILHRSIRTQYVGELAVDLWYYQIGLIKVNDSVDKLFENKAVECVTQLLWKGSKELGVGAAVDGWGRVIIVANFNPPGNVENLYLDNLPKFSQNQINEGRKLQNVIDDIIYNPMIYAQEKQLDNLPGWSSVLHQALDEKIKSSKHSEPLNFTPNEVEKIRKDVLEKSNLYRKKHKITLLESHKGIDNYAQEWADILAKNNLFRERITDPEKIVFGEILHKSSMVQYVGELAVDVWYYSIGSVNVNDSVDKLYENKTAACVTQLLWKESKQIGVGVAIDGRDNVIIVANFNPPGNIEKSYVNNLPKFTQKEIDEGKSFRKAIDDGKTEPLTNSQDKKLRKFPGWNSVLHQVSEQSIEIVIT